jgi:hypothetical protein
VTTGTVSGNTPGPANGNMNDVVNMAGGEVELSEVANPNASVFEQFAHAIDKEAAELSPKPLENGLPSIAANHAQSVPIGRLSAVPAQTPSTTMDFHRSQVTETAQENAVLPTVDSIANFDEIAEENLEALLDVLAEDLDALWS